MGFRPEPTNYQLEFTEYPGLQVLTSGATIGEMLDISDMQTGLQGNTSEERSALFRAFAAKLVMWNIEHPQVKGDTCARCGLREGAPVPTTAEAMMCLPMSLVMRIIMGWTMHMMKASVPKEMSSFVGGTNTPEDLTKTLAALQNPLT